MSGPGAGLAYGETVGVALYDSETLTPNNRSSRGITAFMNFSSVDRLNCIEQH
jgi:hypothetical protein